MFTVFEGYFKGAKPSKVSLAVAKMLRITPLASFSSRQFTSSTILLKKTASGKKNAKLSIPDEEVEETVDVSQYVKRAQDAFQKTLELHKKKLNEFKQGVANPHVFDRLKLKDGSKFKDVASTSMKGKNALLVTVYDPKDTKNVISTIMAAGLNLNPERVPNNDQQLKIALPPLTTETRTNMCKDLKKIFEEYKNSSSKDSLGYVRSEILKEMKHLAKKNDSVKKTIQDIEKIHKDYVTQMQQQLVQAEKNVTH
ncbi:RRF1 (YHR038W) [Zygosaccharomyces parabailii]|uniref:Ribosome-recycling factor, mitochondrial n=1 Tax=Zygosaccharomyces bailii (strain CLIB 213 / ATCC 58445 / CBS 680 / BCRC 21525 / NBRC 1098 / NCYC 1416 / NRRL Y-2227) TaxID=1333698 RepID=A0A8J2T8H3_ZYGB2|nr:RRF1 (YHR038W) [Zygosaccharomyces parabailii]CDF89190.1 ZYBA0S03-11276g1_1 [Zygosaccharomyces bailii CLIB 213]